jgi:hypothetical protein
MKEACVIVEFGSDALTSYMCKARAITSCIGPSGPMFWFTSALRECF